ncbi:hypothetical protein [Candidatus Electronema sp. JC]|uniref:hypothetical protein n=1 Tax=Candidatus Electronema sp. JC TaxID=3401570 RepID=UPI003B428C2B
MDYVIVGGSIAAASGLAAVRRNLPDAEIRVVADEPLPFCCRPLIPYLLRSDRRRAGGHQGCRGSAAGRAGSHGD